MKMKTIFASMFAMAALASCSNENDDFAANELPSGDFQGYISISIPSQSGGQTRANAPGTEAGTATDSDIAEATVILCDEMRVTDFQSFKSLESGTKTGTMKVSSDSKYAFVIVNTPADVTAKIGKGALIADIQGVLASATVDNLTQANKFVMTSAGAYTDANSKRGLLPIASYIKKTEGEAKTSRMPINVDRAVAKINVSTDINQTTKPAGTEFELKGWLLNVTNKKFSVYTSLIDFEGQNQTPKSVYREDINFTISAAFGTPGYETEMEENFTTLDCTDTYTTWKTTTGSEYCFENTMAATEQLVDRTTNVIFKAEYTPKGFTKGDSYFKYAGVLHTFDDIDALIRAVDVDGNPVNADLVTAADEVAKAVLNDNNKNWKDDVASVGILDAIDNGGSLAAMCKLRYYQNGINYYRGNIMHDQRLATMALGKFGVVRNNSYNLSIKSIKGEGEPWIPGPVTPENPDQPGTDEDEDAYISIDVIVNDWALWTQGFEM